MYQIFVTFPPGAVLVSMVLVANDVDDTVTVGAVASFVSLRAARSTVLVASLLFKPSLSLVPIFTVTVPTVVVALISETVLNALAVVTAVELAEKFAHSVIAAPEMSVPVSLMVVVTVPDGVTNMHRGTSG